MGIEALSCDASMNDLRINADTPRGLCE
jgi:hypothetical protein